MRGEPFAIASCVALLLGTPAHAGNGAKEQAQLRKLTYKYASCVAGKHHAKASEAVLATASNHTIIHHFPQIVDSDCLVTTAGDGVDMHFPNDTYQYALADALVSADFGAKEIASFSDRLPLAQPTVITADERAEYLGRIKGNRQRKEAEDQLMKQTTLARLLRYGECVARADPINARYWLLTPPETPEESSRIKAMQPAFGSCLSDGTIHFNRTVIRGIVAVNYYRLAIATVVPAIGNAH